MVQTCYLTTPVRARLGAASSCFVTFQSLLGGRHAGDETRPPELSITSDRETLDPSGIIICNAILRFRIEAANMMKWRPAGSRCRC